MMVKAVEWLIDEFNYPPKKNRLRVYTQKYRLCINS